MTNLFGGQTQNESYTSYTLLIIIIIIYPKIYRIILMALIITSPTLPHDLNAINDQKHKTTKRQKSKNV